MHGNKKPVERTRTSRQTRSSEKQESPALAVGSVNEFGQRLGDELEKAGMSQGEFARMIGVVPSCVNHWINGRNTPNEKSREKIRVAVRKRMA
jgi:ribosome-binding protein aMBF1 (putative translation factor)